MNKYSSIFSLELALSKYTGAPYVITVRSCSDALFLCMKFAGVKGKDVSIPSHTFPSVLFKVYDAGAKPIFYKKNEAPFLTGRYKLEPFSIYDSALRLTSGMYDGGFHCLSFTGENKHVSCGGMGGAILTSDLRAAEWLTCNGEVNSISCRNLQRTL